MSSEGSARSDEISDSSAGSGESSREDRIRTLAYMLYLKRGEAHGYDVEDWLQAEIQIDRELVS
jgi:hypothetical protein